MVAGITVAGLADSAELFVVAYLGTRIVGAAAFSDATPGAGLDRAALPIALLLAAATVASVCVSKVENQEQQERVVAWVLWQAMGCIIGNGIS